MPGTGINTSLNPGNSLLDGIIIIIPILQANIRDFLTRLPGGPWFPSDPALAAARGIFSNRTRDHLTCLRGAPQKASHRSQVKTHTLAGSALHLHLHFGHVSLLSSRSFEQPFSLPPNGLPLTIPPCPLSGMTLLPCAVNRPRVPGISLGKPSLTSQRGGFSLIINCASLLDIPPFWW